MIEALIIVAMPVTLFVNLYLTYNNDETYEEIEIEDEE